MAYIGMLLGLLLSFLGIVGYVTHTMWLLYVAGGLITFVEVTELVSGRNGCLESIAKIAIWIMGYTIVGSILDGVLFGSCISFISSIVANWVYIKILIYFNRKDNII